jgi:histidine ammonia-lyase
MPAAAALASPDTGTRRAGEPIVIDEPRGLRRWEVLALAHGRSDLSFGASARRGMRRSHDLLAHPSAHTRDVSGAGDERAGGALQAHIAVRRDPPAAGGGELDAATVRAAMALRAVILARGHSAVRPAVADLLTALLARDVVPCVPSPGGGGSGGDPVLLGHVAATLTGDGSARVAGGAVMRGADALAAAGLRPLELEPREWLALVNGLDFSIAAGTLGAERTAQTLAWSEGVAALTFDVLQGSPAPLLGRVQRLRGLGEHLRVAERLAVRVADSRMTGGAAEPGSGRHDPYALRCLPQVYGAAQHVLVHVQHVIDREMCATIDDPLVFAEGGDAVRCGHCHGEALALALDYLALALVGVANAIDARLALLLCELRRQPPVPAAAPGPGSVASLGVASAAALERLRALACPVSIDRLAAPASHDDRVSAAWDAARRSEDLTTMVNEMIAAEAAAGLLLAELLGPERLGRGTRAIYEQLRGAYPEDRPAGPTPAAREGLSSLFRDAPCAVP